MIYQDQIRTAMRELEMSADFLSAMAEISGSKLSRFMRNTAPLSGPEVVHLMKIVAELRELADDARPYVLMFRDPKFIRGLLAQRRSGFRFIPMVVPVEERQAGQ